jgi:radical SAM superfamily enzyme YgiQ (UPF0313 family)
MNGAAMNVLLAQGYITTWHANQLYSFPGNGLISIASNMNADRFHVRVLDDLHRQAEPVECFVRTMSEFTPAVIGFGCMTFQYHSIVALARRAREIDPSVIIVLGGYHATVAYQEIALSPDMELFDYVVRGEGEVVFNDLLEHLDDPAYVETIPGLTYRVNGSVRHNAPPELVDLEVMKFPDRSLRQSGTGYHFLGRGGYDIVETSRGCPFTCNFCCITQMYGRSFRTISLARVIDELHMLKRRGVKRVIFTDDNITVNGKRVMELCRMIVDEKLNTMEYLFQASVKGLLDTPGLIELMREANVWGVVMGIENPSEEGLKYYKKANQFAEDDTYVVVRRLRKAGIKSVVAIIIGQENEDRESIRRLGDYVERLEPDMANFQYLTPYPGTEIRTILLEKNLVVNVSDFSKYTTTDCVIRTHHLTQEELKREGVALYNRYVSKPINMFRLIQLSPPYVLKYMFRMMTGNSEYFWKVMRMMFGKLLAR